ncbi:hypothetical protein AN639_01735 [Candidatus Epulonipiscium fishelsonii]|uniref:Uncharacterized protein n=1 Tax=Candidatus Epulonipiscium fishelsonii TaxID=77094 RepID=A0ACC8XED1_9FIRM|nr:hypothetical protein AN639_01735 [Epulopiscium sp. SCG-B05WGA-EpuloA1]ONI41223.1 hypothetical protein AN396_03815 [Epulopiscium sp. SCG-B11WGA-EpuloA1]
MKINWLALSAIIGLILCGVAVYLSVNIYCIEKQIAQKYSSIENAKVQAQEKIQKIDLLEEENENLKDKVYVIETNIWKYSPVVVP